MKNKKKDKNISIQSAKKQDRLVYLESFIFNVKTQVQGIHNLSNEEFYNDAVKELFDIIDNV